MDVGGEARTVRAAENQSIFRDVNERIEELNQQHGVVGGVGEWVCECADTSCTERISMTPAEYERMRAHPNRFAVAPGHVLPDVEHVVDETDRFVLVSKKGPGGEKARRLDPRVSS
jgi:hypothetical protein